RSAATATPAGSAASPSPTPSTRSPSPASTASPSTSSAGAPRCPSQETRPMAVDEHGRPLPSPRARAEREGWHDPVADEIGDARRERDLVQGRVDTTDPFVTQRHAVEAAVRAAAEAFDGHKITPYLQMYLSTHLDHAAADAAPRVGCVLLPRRRHPA